MALIGFPVSAILSKKYIKLPCMVSFFTIHGSYCWVGSLMPLSSFHMKLFFYKHTAASLPDYLFTGRSSRINMGIIPIQSAASPLKFSWDSSLRCRISGRLTDQYMGIYLHFHNPDGDCHAGTCHLFVNLMILNIQLCMGPLPPLVGGSDEWSISTSESTSQCWNIYFQPEIPDYKK